MSNINIQIANNSIDPQLNSTNQNSNSNSNNTQSLSNPRLQSLLDRFNANDLNENNLYINDNDNTFQHIEDLLESILFLISNEKTKIQNEKANLINARQKFKEESELRYIKHQKEIDNWKQSLLEFAV